MTSEHDEAELGIPVQYKTPLRGNQPWTPQGPDFPQPLQSSVFPTHGSFFSSPFIESGLHQGLLLLLPSPAPSFLIPQSHFL